MSTYANLLAREFYDKMLLNFLKGQYHEIFDPRFFSLVNPPPPPPPRVLIQGLKPFRIWLSIRRENRDNRSKS
jgi:hypothetical protein